MKDWWGIWGRGVISRSLKGFFLCKEVCIRREAGGEGLLWGDDRRGRFWTILGVLFGLTYRASHAPSSPPFPSSPGPGGKVGGYGVVGGHLL